MARTIINLPLRNSVDESYNTAVNILQANGFKEVSYNGETVWKKGTGLLTAMQYIKIEFTDTTLVVSGWVQAGVGNPIGKSDCPHRSCNCPMIPIRQACT